MSTSVHHPPALTGRLQHAVSQAILAPSGHNTQPWLFRLLPDGIDLLADRSRACPVVDPENRELHISCGAALYHLRLAMNADGLATLVRVLPRPLDNDHLARVLVAGPHVASEEEQELLAAMPHRRTNRLAFESREIDATIQAEWAADVAAYHSWIRFVQAPQEKRQLADLISEGDRRQASNKAFRQELAKWVHSNRSSRRDGIPGYAQGIGDFASYFGSLVVRTFDWGNGQAAKDRQLAEGSPLLAVIGTDRDTPQDWMACGQALAKVLLRATSRSIHASYLNQPIEIPELRQQLASRLVTRGFPQLLLRLGYGDPPPATPRRLLDEVVLRN